MDSPAIKVEGLSKRYRIGARLRQRNFREALTDAALAPLRRLKSFGRSSHREEDSIWALRQVSFEVRQGEVLGIIGPNGAGKTTLLKLLSRITDPTEGRAVLNGRVGSLLEVGTGFHSELTGWENIYLSGAILGMRKAEIDARFDQIVAFSGIEPFIDTPVKRYSHGMRVRLGFAVAAHLEPEILLVDEVLAVGDAAFKRKSLGKMGELQKGGRTVIFVSHNMASIKNLCTSCIALDKGRIMASGDVADTVQRYLQAFEPVGDAGSGGGFSFEVPRPEPAPEAYITRVELLDEDRAVARRLETRACFRARIHFRSEVASGRFSLRLSLQTLDGAPLILYDMEQTGGFHLACDPGDHFADVVMPELPLAAGHYVIGAAISVPHIRLLHNAERTGEIEVSARDAYGTGSPLSSQRCFVAVEHFWQVPDDDEGLREMGYGPKGSAGPADR